MRGGGLTSSVLRRTTDQIIPALGRKMVRHRRNKLHRTNSDMLFRPTKSMHLTHIFAAGSGFRILSATATDSDVKDFAAATLPTLKQHIEMIHGMAKRMNVKME